MPFYHPLLHFILYFLLPNCQTKILNRTDNEIFHIILFIDDTYCLLWKRNRLTKLFVSFFFFEIYMLESNLSSDTFKFTDEFILQNDLLKI